MKKRRTLIISLLLVAALCLGIGYAAVTDTLTINGSASLDGSELVEEFDGDVYFSAYPEASGKLTESTLSADKDTATFAVEGLNQIGETVVLNYTIKNEYKNPVWVSLSGDPANASNQYIAITHDFPAEAQELASGATIDVQVTVTVIEASTQNETLEGYKLVLEASDVDPNA